MGTQRGKSEEWEGRRRLTTKLTCGIRPAERARAGAARVRCISRPLSWISRNNSLERSRSTGSNSTRQPKGYVSDRGSGTSAVRREPRSGSRGPELIGYKPGTIGGCRAMHAHGTQGEMSGKCHTLTCVPSGYSMKTWNWVRLLGEKAPDETLGNMVRGSVD